jgi:imidazolonepropionase-like amidohydrolase
MKTFVLCFFATLLSCTSYGQQSVVTAIKCGTLIDVRQGKKISPAVILIEGNKITAVGPNVQIPPGVPVIDLSMATVLPGLFDLHCHFLDNNEGGTRGSAADNALCGVRNAEKILLSGFTTIRDPGGGSPNYANVSVRDAVNRGWFPGPRIVVAGRFLSITGGHGDNNNVAPEYETERENIVNGVDEMRKAVRRDVKFGADWIKLYVTGGFFSAGDDPREQHFSDEEIRTAVEEATHLGKFVAAHSHGAQGIKAGIKAGVRTIEHGTFIDDEGIELMKKNGTYLVPTMRTIEMLAEEPPPNASTGRKKAYQLATKYFTQMLENIGKAMARGVKTAFGSDMVTAPHGLAAQEFRLHVKAGQSPMEAIRSATIVSAEGLNMQETVGSIDPGKFADIIAVRGDPLSDVTVLENVGFVMKDGKVYKNELIAGK